MVCHGGLPSEDSVSLKDIREAYRFVEPPEKGMMCDLIWADPTPQNGRSPSKRGASMGFGPDITNKFLDINGLSR
jgi:serine/threonine-protein phosphatase 5